MLFDLSQYIPFNAFAAIWLLCVLAGFAFACRKDNKGE